MTTSLFILLFYFRLDLFARIIHINSLTYRIIFIQNALEKLSFKPHPIALISELSFSADSYILWQGYHYGSMFILIIITTFIMFFFASKAAGNIKLAIIVLGVLTLNFISNGVFVATPNNILLPVILGWVGKILITKHKADKCTEHMHNIKVR